MCLGSGCSPDHPTPAPTPTARHLHHVTASPRGGPSPHPRDPSCRLPKIHIEAAEPTTPRQRVGTPLDLNTEVNLPAIASHTPRCANHDNPSASDVIRMYERKMGLTVSAHARWEAESRYARLRVRARLARETRRESGAGGEAGRPLLCLPPVSRGRDASRERQGREEGGYLTDSAPREAWL